MERFFELSICCFTVSCYFDFGSMFLVLMNLLDSLLCSVGTRMIFLYRCFLLFMVMCCQLPFGQSLTGYNCIIFTHLRQLLCHQESFVNEDLRLEVAG